LPHPPQAGHQLLAYPQQEDAIIANHLASADRFFASDQIVNQHHDGYHRQQVNDSSCDVQNKSQQPQNQKDRDHCSKHGFRIVLSSSALFPQALKPSELIRKKLAREFEVREPLRNAAHVSTRNAGFAMHRSQPILASVCWDGSVSRTTPVLSEAYLIDQGGLRRPAMISGSPVLSIEIMKGDSMSTEKTGQQSNPNDPTQHDQDKQGQQGQRDQQGYGQTDQQKDRKPGQGQQDNDRERKSA
jgi:hypothetical protein